jgi:hypothetical protein
MFLCPRHSGDLLWRFPPLRFTVGSKKDGVTADTEIPQGERQAGRLTDSVSKELKWQMAKNGVLKVNAEKLEFATTLRPKA